MRGLHEKFEVSYCSILPKRSLLVTNQVKMIAKAFIGLICLISIVQLGSQADPKCWVGPPESISKLQWPDMGDPCVREIKAHIQRELQASITYLAMGAHFLNAAHYRPGVAKLVLTHAGEERLHAKALIDYILMRGYDITKDEIPTIKPLSTTWDSVFEALNTTLTIEKDVRDYFKKIIFTCEGGSDVDHSDVDYHVSDFLTGQFLDEQHKGVREISEYLTTLGRMLENTGNAAFAEFEFDRTLLAHA